MAIFSYSAIEGKSINIKIDPDDVVKILNELMNSDIFKNFVTHVIQRSMGKYIGFDNPFHPEDHLVSSLQAALIQEHKRVKHKNKPSMNTNLDSLDKENENFVDDHMSDDVFSGKEVIRMSEVRPNITSILKQRPLVAKLVHVLKSTNVVKKMNNFTANEREMSKKDSLPVRIQRDDRANFKPIQTRFITKKRKDIDM